TLLKLPPAERIQLAEDLWDSVAAHPENLPPLTDEERREIDQRLAWPPTTPPRKPPSTGKTCANGSGPARREGQVPPGSRTRADTGPRLVCRLRPGLGREFLGALDTCLEGVLLYPKAHPLVHGEVRRALFRQFPYSLTFRVETDGILVISCRHYRQKPIFRG
ncbi:addiction module protein, partial [Pseudomonas tohonis]|uniref:addiction module protein n=1 Tax=Pseudomonas tohonis TaxID=2725477 RepID=UPI001F2BF658